MKILCKKVSKGIAKGLALTSSDPISFLGGVDPDTGLVVEKGHPLEGECLKDRVLIFPKGKGSTVGAYVIYQLKKSGNAPAAIINERADVMVASGAIIAGIPAVHMLEVSPYSIKSKSEVLVDADSGIVEVLD